MQVGRRVRCAATMYELVPDRAVVFGTRLKTRPVPRGITVSLRRYPRRMYGRAGEAGKTQLSPGAVRRCRRCVVTKPLEEFASHQLPNGRRKTDCYCRPCRKAYQHEWYLKNREQALAAAAARRAAERANRAAPSTPPVRRPLREAVGFRAHANPRVQGDEGLGIAIAYFTRVGLKVAIPLTDSQRYDLIIDDGQRLQRVQVRTTTMKRGRGYVVHLRTIGGNKSQVITRAFDPSDYEWLFVVCGDGTAYLIPTTSITARFALYLSRKYEPYRIVD